CCRRTVFEFLSAVPIKGPARRGAKNNETPRKAYHRARNGARIKSQTGSNLLKLHKKLVPGRGLEPPRCYSLVPETSASTNSATRAGEEGRAMYARGRELSIERA